MARDQRWLGGEITPEDFSGRYKIVWEVSILVFDDSYDDAATEEPRSATVLSPGKVLGLMVAYCDNDGSELRENFIGSQPINSGDRDRGYIDAGVFGKLELTDS